MFDISDSVAVVTSRRVTTRQSPVLLVVHQHDEESGVVWQFLDGLEFNTADTQLVRLDTILGIAPDVAEVSTIPIGWIARRNSKDSPWVIEPDPEV
jgi:hypothetical protein